MYGNEEWNVESLKWKTRNKKLKKAEIKKLNWKIKRVN